MFKQETIKQALSDRNASEVARRTKLSIHTILKMQRGEFANLKLSSADIVSKYLASTGVTEVAE